MEEIKIEETTTNINEEIEEVVEPVEEETTETIEESEEVIKETTEPVEEKSKKSKKKNKKKDDIIPTISLDNQPVSPIIQEQEKEEIPVGFVPNVAPKKKANKNGINIYNGRVYKVINDEFGMWADTGVSFPLDEIK